MRPTDEQIVAPAAAVRALAATDPRPLLLFLPRRTENKKLATYLRQALASERFQLASGWFHCVRMDQNVLEESHPYHSLFAGKHPPRLLLASRDGKKIVRFLGTTTQKVNWPDIAAVLKRDYKSDPTTAIKSIERLLSQFDALDDKRKELNAQLERAATSDQKSKVMALRKKLARNQDRRASLFARKAKLEKLTLRGTGAKKAE